MVTGFRPAIAGVAMLAIGACTSPTPRPMPLAESGPSELVVAGQSFIADLQPGPVLTVSRDTGMGNFEGKLAKDVAAQFCASRGGRLNPQAFGQFAGGSWVFPGGCV